MRKTADLARRHEVRLHTHLAETADEDAYCERKFGKRPLALMEDCGFIGPDVSYAHGVFFTDEELALLARTRTGICHCPSSNMRLGSGITRIREMLPLGFPSRSRVDGSASNDSSDYLGEMRQALLLQRVRVRRGRPDGR
jgi:cytosine/adenosine deaminase-related metal-dependent hydrolase